VGVNSVSSYLCNPNVQGLLADLHAEADRTDPPLLAKAEGKELEERILLLDQAFIPVSPDAGRFLYALARACAAGDVIEFGTSFGISTIYLGAAIRDRGCGRVITTELHAGKASKARDHIDHAGLSDFVDLRVGDALETLKNLRNPVSMVFLDGWKNLYKPVLHLLEPALARGALVLADDLDLFPDILEAYLTYVRTPTNGYVSVRIPIGDAMELSARAQ
jgi:predicted O-methyltransferase YrrM